jgi:hypothetical protein
VTDGHKAEEDLGPSVVVGPTLAISRPERVPEPEVEGGESKDNANVYDQSRPKVVSEEQDVNTDYDADKRKHVNHDGYISLHFPMVLGPSSREKAGVTASPDHKRPVLSLTGVGKSLCLVVEPDNIHDLASPDGQHLKAKGGSTTIVGILCTSHTHTDEQSITEDLDVIDASSYTSVSTPLIPGQDLVAGLAAGIAGARSSPSHVRIKEFGEG